MGRRIRPLPVLIELDLMESPWAYSVMAITILIDAYLLYIFFIVQNRRSHQPMNHFSAGSVDER